MPNVLAQVLPEATQQALHQPITILIISLVVSGCAAHFWQGDCDGLEMNIGGWHVLARHRSRLLPLLSDVRKLSVRRSFHCTGRPTPAIQPVYASAFRSTATFSSLPHYSALDLDKAAHVRSAQSTESLNYPLHVKPCLSSVAQHLLLPDHAAFALQRQSCSPWRCQGACWGKACPSSEWPEAYHPAEQAQGSCPGAAGSQRAH